MKLLAFEHSAFNEAFRDACQQRRLSNVFADDVKLGRGNQNIVVRRRLTL